MERSLGNKFHQKYVYQLTRIFLPLGLKGVYPEKLFLPSYSVLTDAYYAFCVLRNPWKALCVKLMPLTCLVPTLE